MIFLSFSDDDYNNPTSRSKHSEWLKEEVELTKVFWLIKHKIIKKILNIE